MTERAQAELAWTAWPLRRRPARGFVAGGLVAATSWGIWDLTRDPWLSTVAFAILAATVAPDHMDLAISRPSRLHGARSQFQGKTPC